MWKYRFVHCVIRDLLDHRRHDDVGIHSKADVAVVPNHAPHNKNCVVFENSSNTEFVVPRNAHPCAHEDGDSIFERTAALEDLGRGRLLHDETTQIKVVGCGEDDRIRREA